MAALLAVAGATFVLAARESVTASKWDVQAEIALRLVRYTRWPDRTNGSTEPMRIGVVDSTATGEIRERFVRRDRSEDALTVFVLEEGIDMGRLPEIDMLYLERDLDSWSLALIDALESSPVLIVGTRADLLDHGGMIQLKEVSGKIRFVIDLNRSSQCGIRFDAALLNLAEVRR